MDLRDCYRVLDLEPPVSDDQIKRAYRDLTKVWHPDRFGNDAEMRRKAEEKLKAINTAYEQLRAAQKGTWSDAPPPETPPAPPKPDVRNRNWAIACAALAIFMLLRRPTPGGLVIAVVLLVVAVIFVTRMRWDK